MRQAEYDVNVDVGPPVPANPSPRRKHSSFSTDPDSPGPSATQKRRPSAKKVKVGARASIACSFCRKRKVRCTAEWPTCAFCKRKKAVCVYDGHPAQDLAPGETTPLLFTSPHNATFALSQEPEPKLPPQTIIKAAVNAFQTHFVDIGLFGFFHPSDYEAALQSDSPTLTPSNKELLFAVLAITARFLNKQDPLHDSSDAASAYYSNAAHRLISRHQDDKSLNRVKSLIILAMHLCQSEQEVPGWMYLGTAIRLSQILHLGAQDDTEDGTMTAQSSPSFASHNHANGLAPHQPTPNGPMIGQPMNPSHPGSIPTTPSRSATFPLQVEARRRIFWSVFLLERILSNGKDRPVTIRFDPFQITTRLPCFSDVDYRTNNIPHAHVPGTGPRFDPYIPEWARQPGVKYIQEPEADCYGNMLRIADIFAEVITYVGNGGHKSDRRCPWNPDSTFYMLDKRLSDWSTNLPYHLRFDAHNLTAHCISQPGSAKHYAMMHLIYWTSVTYLHRDYFPFLSNEEHDPMKGPLEQHWVYETDAPPNWWSLSANKVFDSADSLALLVESLESHGLMLYNAFAGFAAMTMATVFSQLKVWPKPGPHGIRDGVKGLDAMVHVLEQLQAHLPIAKNWLRNLSKLMALYVEARELKNHNIQASLTRIANRTRNGVMKFLSDTRTDDHSTHSSPRLNPQEYSTERNVIEDTPAANFQVLPPPAQTHLHAENQPHISHAADPPMYFVPDVAPPHHNGVDFAMHPTFDDSFTASLGFDPNPELLFPSSSLDWSAFGLLNSGFDSFEFSNVNVDGQNWM